MTAERLTHAVRRQIGLGRLLPLGEAADGAWVTEEAALGVLGRSVRAVPGTRLSAVRMELTSPRAAAEPAVPPPPSALPPGPLTLTAELAVPAGRPVPAAAEDVRRSLLSTAEEELGLPLETVDLRVTELLEAEAPGAEPGSGPDPGSGPETGVSGSAGTAHSRTAERVTRAVLAVEGVVRLAPVPGPALSHVAAGPAAAAVQVEGDPATDRGCHVLLQLGLAPTRRALDTARAAAGAARSALGASGKVTVAVVVTAIDRV
ncbi:hypothetical protein [Streptomyces spirodelae]|uniref:Nucleopolyhedrovirus P10 family protein n=1 Tax=Streptomyces spirodelae TaxID=2812904 RepID=A0ABS3WZ18_9ACTN|nr:hypothetical protein [Streptomyces spirodelae]MBO8188369.1 hypothetical protein [Streptomyces spirodelae]